MLEFWGGRKGGRGQLDKMFIMLLKACQLRVFILFLFHFCISQIQIRKQAATKVGHDAAGCTLWLPRLSAICADQRAREREREEERQVERAREREIYEQHLVAKFSGAKSLWLSY